jgi:hypothetical protein
MRNLGIVVLAGCVSTTQGTTEKISVVTASSGVEASIAGRTILGFLNENHRIFWTTVHGAARNLLLCRLQPARDLLDLSLFDKCKNAPQSFK